MTTTTHDQTDLATRAQAVLDLPLAVEPINIIPEPERPTTLKERRDAYRQSALVVTNRVRKLMGLAPLPDLLPGQVGDMTSCTVAASIAHGALGWDVSVTGEAIEVNGPNGEEIHLGRDADSPGRRLPQRFEDFIDRFDEEMYPDLMT